jgi:hypothetical protein
VGRISIGLRDLLAADERLLRRAPVHALELFRTDAPALGELARRPWLAGVDELTLVEPDLDASSLVALAMSPFATGLRHLEVRSPRGLADAAVALDAFGTRLRRLTLSAPGEVDPQRLLRTLSVSPAIGTLERLSLVGIALEDDGFARLMQAMDPARLTHLVVREHALTAASAAPLRALTELRTLDLGCQPWRGQVGALGDGGVECLAASLPPAIVELGLACQRLSERGVAAVVAAAPSTLRDLDLCGNGLAAAALDGVRALRLRRLGLSGNPCGPGREVVPDLDGTVAGETFDLATARVRAAELEAEWVY